MIKAILLIPVTIVLFSACQKKSNQEPRQSEAIQPTDTVTTIAQDTATTIPTVSEANLITEQSAGIFKIGAEIPTMIPGFTIKKEMRDGAEGDQYPTYIVKEQDRVVLTITPGVDDSYEYTNKIGDIVIESDRYKTSDGIGVTTTIDEFIAKNPTYKLWYSYIGGMFVLETPNLKTQFNLDGKDFIGDSTKLEDSDMVTLSRSDFKKDAKITTVRLY